MRRRRDFHAEARLVDDDPLGLYDVASRGVRPREQDMDYDYEDPRHGKGSKSRRYTSGANWQGGKGDRRGKADSHGKGDAHGKSDRGGKGHGQSSASSSAGWYTGRGRRYGYYDDGSSYGPR